MNEPAVVTPVAPVDDFIITSNVAPPEGHDAMGQPLPVDADGNPIPPADPVVEVTTEEARNDKGQFRKRAKSQEAKAGDVPRIQELTKNWRTAEAERDALRAELDLLRRPVPAAAPASASPAVAATPAPVAAGTFATPEPKPEDFLKEDDPYGAHLLALGEWRAERRQFDAEQKRHAAEQSTSAETATREAQQAYTTRVVAFTKTHSDFATVLAALNDAPPSPPLLEVAIKTADNGPELVYALAQRPELYYEMHLLTDGRAVTQPSVASLQRLLTSRVSAVTTGSATPLPPTPSAPRPPNPVRTGPLKTGDDPPDDSASLEAHESHFKPKRR
jgi:hypothetical protein